MRKIVVKKGDRFGRLIVLSEIPRRSNSRWILCACDCGLLKETRLNDARMGKVKSCGCFHREMASKASTTHGRSNDPVYRVWASMVERCSSPDCSSYPRYGGRGIEVCERWLKFENFISDMGERPEGNVRYTIERVNNELGYSKDNCKWATYAEQSNNTSANVLIEFRGVTRNLTQWCRELSIPVGAMIHRIRAGWSTEEAFGTPHPSPYRVRRKDVGI